MKICFECEIDWELVNYILMPIITLISVFLYFLALRNSQKQNEVFLSQNIKPNFEKEIDALAEEGQKIIIQKEIVSLTHSYDNRKQECNGLDIFYFFILILKDIHNNEDFIDDWVNRNSSSITRTELTRKSYYPYLNFCYAEILNDWTTLGQYFSKIINLWKQIENSRMINEDKFLTLKILERKINHKILRYYDQLFNSDLFSTYLPIPVDDNKIDWVKIEKFSLVNAGREMKLLTEENGIFN